VNTQHVGDNIAFIETRTFVPLYADSARVLIGQTFAKTGTPTVEEITDVLNMRFQYHFDCKS